MILTALVEGNSIASVCRMMSVSKVTVLRLLADAGTLAADYHDLTVRDLQCERVQVDELWSFVGAKQKQVDRGANAEGSVWTWTAIDADSKLCISYLVGLRDAEDATLFCRDTASRLASRVQLTSDGHRAYLPAVEDAFGGAIDYAMLVKIYGTEPGAVAERRYSPAVCTGCRQDVLAGNPDPDHIMFPPIPPTSNISSKMCRTTRADAPGYVMSALPGLCQQLRCWSAAVAAASGSPRRQPWVQMRNTN